MQDSNGNPTYKVGDVVEKEPHGLGLITGVDLTGLTVKYHLEFEDCHEAWYQPPEFKWKYRP